MSLFQELKRRNVFRVGIAYAVAAWVILQLTDVVIQIMELPAWGGQMILLGLLVGFIPALIFAWAFEMTPEGVKRESDVDRSQSVSSQTGKKLNAAILVLMAVAIGYLLFDKFLLRSDPAEQSVEQVTSIEDEGASAEKDSPDAGGTGTDAEAISARSIAVLPFANRSELDEDAFFVEGIHDDLLTSLARISSLKVISRTSVNQYRSTEKTIPEIANELRVATIMEGAVQRAGNTIRVNVQLIDAQTDEHLWAEIFDRELNTENLFAIQSEISSKIAEALQATLTGDEKRRINSRPTDSLAAYNAYLRGRQLLSRRQPAELEMALGEFRRAVELDPEFALAWAGISESATLQLSWGSALFSDVDPIRKEAADKAIELAPELGEGYLAKATTMRGGAESEAMYQRAIELSPGYATAYQWYANAIQGKPERMAQAQVLLEKAVELDPLAPILRDQLAFNLMFMGRFTEAEDELLTLLKDYPEYFPALTHLASVQRTTGRIDEAILTLEQALLIDSGTPWIYLELIELYETIGDEASALDSRARLAELDSESPFLGIADTIIAMHNKNFAAAKEATRWTQQRFGPNDNNSLLFEANLLMFTKDYAGARAVFERVSSEYFDPVTLNAAVRDDPGLTCVIAEALRRTGDVNLGASLSSAAIDYVEKELPVYQQHALLQSGVELCYVVQGDFENALRVIETLIDHGHYATYSFQDIELLDAFAPLRSEPRFIAAYEKKDAEMARQLENLKRIRSNEASL